MKKTDIIMLFGMAGAIAFTNIFSAGRTLYSLERDVLRLHILANSDSEDDQQLKLAVRDKLLENSDELFGGCDTLDEMKDRAKEKQSEINDIAMSVIYDKGYDYAVSNSVVNMEFDDRTYGDMTMPAGTYDALRVEIGSGQGHNWWCVMYPPLCLPAAEEVKADKSKANEYFTDKQLDMLENHDDYKVRLWCVDFFEKIVSLF